MRYINSRFTYLLTYLKMQLSIMIPHSQYKREFLYKNSIGRRNVRFPTEKLIPINQRHRHCVISYFGIQKCPTTLKYVLLLSSAYKAICIASRYCNWQINQFRFFLNTGSISGKKYNVLLKQMRPSKKQKAQLQHWSTYHTDSLTFDKLPSVVADCWVTPVCESTRQTTQPQYSN